MIRILELLGLPAYCGLLYWLSNQPSLPAPMWFVGQDKLFHAGAYFLLAVSAWCNFRHFAKPPIILAATLIVFSSLYGASDEWHQAFVPGRTSSVLDWLADTAGAGLAALVLLGLSKSKD
ncbi:MAG: VanZ family protein [Methylovulum sp.]|uniref:VanZ family protein n=1 Tax=Methylovulum sp. TaxID=1916980 RepID=UPI00260FBC76|nr:VanZ family protein [Methylovulum sp.]MDD2724281.1 VanZ family protein [Methylovulum sp.]